MVSEVGMLRGPNHRIGHWVIRVFVISSESRPPIAQSPYYWPLDESHQSLVHRHSSHPMTDPMGRSRSWRLAWVNATFSDCVDGHNMICLFEFECAFLTIVIIRYTTDYLCGTQWYNLGVLIYYSSIRIRMGWLCFSMKYGIILKVRVEC